MGRGWVIAVPHLVEHSTVETWIVHTSTVWWFVSDLGGLPGVGWFIPLCPLITLWAIRSVCVSALPGSGGLGGMPVLSGLDGESDIPGITGIHGNRSNSRYSPVSGIGARCPICPIRSGLLSKRTLGTYRALEDLQRTIRT